MIHRSPFLSRHRQRGRIALGTLAAGAFIVVGVVVAYWLLSRPPHIERRPAASTPPPSVAVMTLEDASAAPQITGYGRVIAARETQVSTRVGGRLEHFADGVEPGRVVAAGEQLAQIEAADYQLAVRTAQADLAQAESDLSIERGEQIQAQSDYKSFGRQLSDERRALVLREPQLKAAKAAVDSAQAALESARLELQRTQIEAPYRGMIEERLVGPGSAVAANTALISLVDVTHFWVRVSLSNESLSWLETGSNGTPGAAVTLTSEGWPTGANRRGRVFSVLPSLEENGLMAQVLVRVDDPLALNGEGPPLRLGDVVAADFAATPRDDLIALPNAALHDTDKVWILDGDNQLRITPVDVLHRGEQQVLIADDGPIDANNRVITSPLARPREGMTLRVAGESGGNADEPGQLAAGKSTADTPATTTEGGS